jgi:iron-sulfur cluster assembly accessory protein
MSEPLITVTEAAATQIRRAIENRQGAGGLRFGLRDGGCSGYSYLFDFEPAPTAEDIVVEERGVKVFISPMHLPFVQGAVLDWKTGRFEEGFAIDNPHAKRTCGCGESFDV